MSPRLAMTRAQKLSVCAVAAALPLAAATHGVPAGVDSALAYLLPPLLLLAALAMRRYPGERALLALIGRRPRRRVHAPVAASPRPRPRALIPRGGCLIACSLAVRPPPARVAGSLR